MLLELGLCCSWYPASSHVMFCRWLSNSRPRHLRHNAVRTAPCGHMVCGTGMQYGLSSAGSRRARLATLAAKLSSHDPPAVRTGSSKSLHRTLVAMVLAVLTLLFLTFLSHVLQGQATDIQIHAEEIMKMKTQINQLYVKHTHQPLEVIGESWMVFL